MHKNEDDLVSFYVPTFNSEKTIRRCLVSIQNQNITPKEILVVDAGSTDNTVKIAQELGVKTIVKDSTLGLAAARNIGIQNTTGEYVASVDSDVELSPEWLKIVLNAIKKEGVGGVGGRLIETSSIYTIQQWRFFHMQQNWGEKEITPKFLFGADNIYRREALLNAGLYDESFTTNHEDVDICEKLTKKGYRLLYLPEATCFHLREDTVKSNLDNYWNWFKDENCEKNRYADIPQKLVWDIDESFKLLEMDVKEKKFHFVYPSFLLSIHHILSDLNFYYCIGQRENQQYFSEIFKRIKENLIQEIVPSILEKELIINAILRDLEYITPGKLDRKRYDKYLKKIELSIKPNPNNLVSKLVSYFKKSIKKKVPDQELFWKMICVSIQRIEYENKEYAGLKHNYRVALLNLPWTKGDRKGVRAGSRFPFTLESETAIPCYVPFPFFLAYTHSMLKNAEIGVVTTDCIGEGIDETELRLRIVTYNPDLIVVETATPSFQNDIQIVERLKKTNKGSKICLTGAHVSTFPAKVLFDHDSVDFVITGQFENKVVELSKALKGKTDLSSIKGLFWRDGEEIKMSEAKSSGPLFSEFPWPERLTLPLYAYNDKFSNQIVEMPEPNAQMLASRGCPYKCSFCLYPQVIYEGKCYQSRESVDIVDEMEELVKRYGIRAIQFDDDTFNINDSRMKELGNLILNRKLNTKWTFMGRADLCVEETMRLFKKAGLIALKFGVESANQEIVNRCGKNLQIKSVEKTVQMCKILGIKVHLTFTFGLPGETKETIQETIDFVKRVNPDSTQFSITTPFPGTNLYNDLTKGQKTDNLDWNLFDGNRTAVMQLDNLSAADLENALIRAEKEWKTYIGQRQKK